jgi:hypothetical protein
MMAYEAKAMELYKRNRKHVENNPDIHWRALAVIAKQQDTLYRMVHRRIDREIFGRKA